MTYTVSLADTFANTTEQLRGTLNDGYFVTSSESSGTITLRLYHVDAPTTSLDSDATLLNTSGNAFLHAQNNAGDVYLQSYSNATNYVLTKVTQSGGALTLTTIGTFAVPTATYNQQMWVSADASQVLLRQNANGKRCVGLSTVDASQDFDLNTTTGHASGYGVIGHPAADRVLTYCYTHYDVELWDGPGGTLLSSLDDSSYYFTPAGFPATWLTTGTNKTFAVSDMDSGANPVQLSLGLLSSASDTLAWTWSTVGYVTDWVNSTTSAQQVGATWGDLAFFASRTTSSGTASVYVVDTTTQVVYSGGPSTYAPGAFDRSVGFAGAGDVVAFRGFVGTPDWAVWSVAASTGPTYLRQRQSPVRTPSRVRHVDLRQRQTPIITK